MKRGFLFILGMLALVVLLFNVDSYPQGSAQIDKNPWESPKVLAQQSEKDTLQDAFQVTKAEFISENINAWSQIDIQLHSLDELKAIVGKAGEAFGIPTDNTMEAYEIQGVRQVSLEGVNEQNQFVRIMAHSTPEDGSYATYLIADITDSEKERNASQVQSRMNDVFLDYGKKPVITRCISGSLEEHLTEKEITTIQERAFREVSAKRVEGMIQENFISISGYTPALQGEVQTGRGAVNLQVALRYSPSQEKTFVWVGTPVITLEY